MSLCVPNRSVPSQKIPLVSPKLPSPKATSTFGGVRVFAGAVVRQELPGFVARLDHRSSR